jgi:hypothetical protein
MTQDANSNLDEISRVEAALRAVPEDALADNVYHAARRALGAYIATLGGISSNGASVPDLVDEACRFPNANAVRSAALIVARVAYRDALLPEPTGSNKLRLRVVALVEKGIRDIAEKMGVLRAAQTYEKYEIIRQIHPMVCAELGPLQSLAKVEPRHELLLASRPGVLKALNTGVVSAYLSPYEGQRIHATLSHVFNELQNLAALNDASFISRLELVQQHIESEIAWCDLFPTFLSQDYYRPVLVTFKVVLLGMGSEAKDRFVCKITTKRPCPNAAEKRYPLHDADRMVRIIVPMRNEGPGIAGDMQCLVSVREETVQFDPSLFLGDIRPGEFALAVNIMVERPIPEISLTLELTWSEAGRADRNQATFRIKISAQSTNVNWDSLRTAQPYTPEVAEGDEFVGRVARVSQIASRFLRPRMNSCFITGQKRVGKTSLAKAVQAKLQQMSSNFRVLYLEYGAYSAMDSVRTVEALGTELYDAMQNQRRGQANSKMPEFQGTLSPLVKIAEAIAKEDPSIRFVFILDEFDEISPEMYRFGRLAEAFFSNIRALSSKTNVAFLLVGGEKMPFVMSAQGDQLNKFTSEQLDYFNRTDEWLDYLDLVRKPVENLVNWDDSAVATIFGITNGHPYYTKLLCATAFQSAVAERDADLTAADVHVGAKRLVAGLDSNAFAHLWKDGISDADVQKAEVVELNRRRTLCASSRALRTSSILTPESVFACTAGLKINLSGITFMMHDFARRGIMVEREGGYAIAVPLFEMWLRDHGASKLLSDALAEEYESALQLEEESARVSSAEIADLVSRWDTYRGMPVTDESVRAWLEQIPTNLNQRLLFKILQKVRFVSRVELRSGLKVAHSFLTGFVPPHYSEKKSDRRRDILVTWVDGAGKSGNVLAGLYAEENRIQQKAVIPPESIVSTLSATQEERPIAAIVIVDDLVGTGESLSRNLKAFVEKCRAEINERRIHVLVTAFACTEKGEQKVRETLQGLDVQIDFRVIDPAATQVSAFPQGRGLWSDDEERGRAKELCQRLGSLVHRHSPLGYGDQGLLLVFPDACPNNSLPILHGSAVGKDHWKPLFERPKH